MPIEIQIPPSASLCQFGKWIELLKWPAFISMLLLQVPSAQGAGLTWPASRFLPAFSAPAATIDCIDVDPVSSAEKALFVSLEGIVNRTQPRLACVSTASEGEFTWMNIHNLSYDTINGYSAILKYETNVTGLAVTTTRATATNGIR